MSITTEAPADARAIRRSARRLSIYLNDHLAGSTLGVELVKRASSENKGTPLGVWLAALSQELEEDRATLVRLMEQLGVRRNRIEIGAAWIVEKVGRLKLNGQLTGYSPLSPLVELEALHRRINGKLDMWKALGHSLGHRVDEIDFDQLARRAERQAEELERYRLDVAAHALSYRDGSAAAHRSGLLASA
jgi:hypothetical protein